MVVCRGGQAMPGLMLSLISNNKSMSSARPCPSSMRFNTRSNHVVPSRHGVHLPHDSRAKNRTILQHAATMSVDWSITTMAPEPSIDPALSTVGLSSAMSRCSGKNHIADAPPGIKALTLPPLRTPPQYSEASNNIRNVVTPLGTSNTPGLFT